ncbi:hypothetical protein ABUW04_04390 [Streptacidiphilus sp. N1-10]|uniref:Transmembrane protein n=1 Tax=Streptacidiphilus jeojiensis TaxID=3229225 RepID=A0ABV6XGV1_9ACTN
MATYIDNSAEPQRLPTPVWYGPLVAVLLAVDTAVLGTALTHPRWMPLPPLVSTLVLVLVLRMRTQATGVRLPLASRITPWSLAVALGIVAAAGVVWALCALLGATAPVTTAVVSVVVGLGTWAKCLWSNARLRQL